MKFYDKVTGNDLRQTFKKLNIRINELPPEYQDIWQKIQGYLWEYSDFSGRTLLPILDGILGLLEESALDVVENIIGQDIKEFTTAVATDEGAENLRNKWRNQLNQSIEKKLRK
jgi:DNA-binding ferritin-like protein (Dps family)